MNLSSSLPIDIAYITSIGLGGKFLGKKAASGLLYFWNRCQTDSGLKISEERKKNIITISGIVSGLFFAVIVAREVFSERNLSRRIASLKGDVRGVEKEVRQLSKLIYDHGVESIRNFKLGPFNY